MQTKYIKYESSDIPEFNEAAKAFTARKACGFSYRKQFYGLGADALNSDAVKIYNILQRKAKATILL